LKVEERKRAIHVHNCWSLTICSNAMKPANLLMKGRKYKSRACKDKQRKEQPNQ